MKALEILKKAKDRGLNGDSIVIYEDEINEAIKEFEELNKEDKTTLKDYVFTNCNDCINKIDNKFTSACFGCKRYYGCRFKKK